MMNPDEANDAIARVVQGLREAKAPEGMEQRILRAMQERASEPRVRAARPWIWSLGVATVAAAALIAVWVHRVPRKQVDQIAVKRTIENIVTPAVTHKVAGETSPLVRPAARPKVKLAEKPSSAPVSNEDELAMSEMMAPSQPAPPMPLTEQERLLLRAVHDHDPVELAMLEPEKRAAQFQKEKAEVKSFFEPSTKDNKGDKE